MAAKLAALLVLTVTYSSMFGESMGNKDWFWNWGSNFNYTDWWNCHHLNKTTQPQSKTLVVGDSQNWHFGFNYTDWAIKNGPFYLNDTLGESSQPLYLRYLLMIYWLDRVVLFSYE